MWSFYKALLKNPKNVGSVWPSSKRLAKVIAHFIHDHPNICVVELGPGTGIITQAILNAGVPPENLIAIDNSPELAKSFQQKFPHIKFLLDDATHLDKHLSEMGCTPSVIISSIPLINLPTEVVKKLHQSIHDSLEPRGRYIQFTYALKNYEFATIENFKTIKKRRVWFNLPPADVYVFEKTSSST